MNHEKQDHSILNKLKKAGKSAVLEMIKIDALAAVSRDGTERNAQPKVLPHYANVAKTQHATFTTPAVQLNGANGVKSSVLSNLKAF